MALEQESLALPLRHNAKLDMAACAVTEALSSKGVKHGFFGGYALSLLGGTRTTIDVDVIVGEEAKSLREYLLSVDSRFFLAGANKLTFKAGTESTASKDIEIPVEMLQGGAGLPLRLPDPNKAPIIRIKPSDIDNHRIDREIPLIHPALITLTKLKRWMFIAESTRPASITKAMNDRFDLEELLRWLVDHELRIDFAMYPEKAKEDLLPGLRKLFSISSQDIRDLLKSSLDPEDFDALT